MKALGNIVVFVVLCLVLVIITYGIGLIPIGIYLAFVFNGANQRIEKSREKLLTNVLMNAEKLQHSAFQLRAHALKNRRQIIVITDSRIILISRKLFGGFKMKDYQWKDLRDAQVDEDMLPNLSGSKLTFYFTNAPALTVFGVPSNLAMDIYRYSQRQEQAWEEKRRVRELEEKRATSGGITIGGASSAMGSTNSNSSSNQSGSAVDEIRKAKELLDMGAISDAEFEEIKAKMLSRTAGSV